MHMVALIIPSGTGFHPGFLGHNLCRRVHDPSPDKWPLKGTSLQSPVRGKGSLPAAWEGCWELDISGSSQTLTLNKVRK